jgi:peptidoglycan/LPS O-acetylase OafA/YrhL
VASQLWTLDVEVPFYVLLPVAAWAAMAATPAPWGPATRRRASLFAIAAVCVGSLSLLRFVGLNDVDRQKWFPMMACSFTPGLALAVLETSVPGWLRDPVRGRRAAIGMLLAGLLAVAYYVASLPHPNLVLRTLAASVGSGLIVGAARVQQWSTGGCWRLLDNRPLHWLGKRAYSLYLLHLLVISQLIVPLDRRPGPAAWLVYMTAGMAVLIPLTAISYRLLERPFLIRRRAWRSSSDAAPAKPLAPTAIPAVLPAE